MSDQGKKVKLLVQVRDLNLDLELEHVNLNQVVIVLQKKQI